MKARENRAVRNMGMMNIQDSNRQYIGVIEEVLPIGASSMFRFEPVGKNNVTYFHSYEQAISAIREENHPREIFEVRGAYSSARKVFIWSEV